MDDSTLTVSCNDCEFDGTETCNDCVVNFLLGRDPQDAVIFDADDARALRLLNGAGLIPTIRHRKRVS